VEAQLIDARDSDSGNDGSIGEIPLKDCDLLRSGMKDEQKRARAEQQRDDLSRKDISEKNRS